MNPKLLAAVILGLITGLENAKGDTLYDAQNKALGKGKAEQLRQGFLWKECNATDGKVYDKPFSFVKGNDCGRTGPAMPNACMGRNACKGRNDCKGQGGCKSSDHSCKARNSCKGKGGCATDLKPKNQSASLSFPSSN
jgi:hypothetical protein